MSIEIRVPTLGESIVDATIASWHKKEGDLIQSGDVLLELETDKVNVEVSAEQDGVLQKVTKQVGDSVAVGEVIAVIEDSARTSDGVAKSGGNSSMETVSQQSLGSSTQPTWQSTRFSTATISTRSSHCCGAQGGYCSGQGQ